MGKIKFTLQSYCKDEWHNLGLTHSGCSVNSSGHRSFCCVLPACWGPVLILASIGPEPALEIGMALGVSAGLLAGSHSHLLPLCLPPSSPLCNPLSWVAPGQASVFIPSLEKGKRPYLTSEYQQFVSWSWDRKLKPSENLERWKIWMQFFLSVLND